LLQLARLAAHILADQIASGFNIIPHLYHLTLNFTHFINPLLNSNELTWSVLVIASFTACFAAMISFPTAV
jgi:hypothetical protein